MNAHSMLNDDAEEWTMAVPGRDGYELAIEANRQAAIALARMDSHVIECTGRYHENREALSAVRESIVRLHERMDIAVSKRQEQTDQAKRDSRNQTLMFLIAIGGWTVLIALHFWKV